MTLAGNQAPRAAEIEAKTRQATEPEASRLDRIRDILFGDRSRVLEERFDTLRSQMVLHLAKLERTIEERTAQLDQNGVVRVRGVEERLQSETEARTTALAAHTQVSQHLQQEFRQQAERIDRMERAGVAAAAAAQAQLAQSAAQGEARVAAEAEERKRAQADLARVLEQSASDQRLALERLAAEGYAADEAIRAEAAHVERALAEVTGGLAKWGQRLEGLEQTLAAAEAQWEARVVSLEDALAERMQEVEQRLAASIDRLGHTLEARLSSVAAAKADRAAVATALRGLAEVFDASANDVPAPKSRNPR